MADKLYPQNRQRRFFGHIWIALSLSILGLAFYGAGAFPFSLFAASAILWIAFAIAEGKASVNPSAFIHPWIEGIALVILILVAISALLPIPLILHPLVGSPRAEHWLMAHSLLSDAAGLPDGPSFSAPYFFFLTASRSGTLRALTLLLACFAAWRLVTFLPSSSKVLWVRFLVFIGAIIAVAGYHSQWTIPQGYRLWWLFPVGHYLPGPVGCFMNRNHYGGFLALLAPLALVLMAVDLRKHRWLFATGSMLGLLLLTGGVLTSLSRGAVLAWSFGMGITGLFIVRRLKAWMIFTLSLCILFVVAISIISLRPAIRDRLLSLRDPQSQSSAHSRLTEWRDTLRIWPSYPLLGTGLNSVTMVYPQYRQSAASVNPRYIENDYLQFLVEGGFIGVALVLGLASALILRKRALIAAGDSNDDQTIILDLACIGALSVSAAHSIVDFPVRLPLYAITFSAIAGLAFNDIPLRWPVWAGNRPRLIIPAIGAVLLLLIAPYARQMHIMDYTSLLAKRDPPTLAKVIQWSPSFQQPWFDLGWHYCSMDPAKYPAEYRLGERCFTYATRLDPYNYRFWYHLIFIRKTLGDTVGAEEALVRAQKLRSWLPRPSILGKGP